MPAGLRGNPCPHVGNQAGFPGTPACRLGVILTIKGEHLPVPAPGAASAGRKAALRARGGPAGDGRNRLYGKLQPPPGDFVECTDSQ
jgi:hypothetical protein